MKVLIDTNVLIDYMAKRDGYYEDARKIICLCSDDKLQAAMTVSSALNAFYILRKDYTAKERREMLLELSKMIYIVGIDTNIIVTALNRDDFKDFEDCVQDECALSYGAKYIITGNVEDFTNSRVKALLPMDFVQMWENQKIQKG